MGARCLPAATAGAPGQRRLLDLMPSWLAAVLARAPRGCRSKLKVLVLPVSFEHYCWHSLFKGSLLMGLRSLG